MKNQVALLAEGVDRNGFSSGTSWNGSQVALLAEGVDRNTSLMAVLLRCQVALLAEGVDRNFSPRSTLSALTVSPSSRRAWIEIPLPS